MKRRLVTLAAAASMLLCITTAVSWTCSAWDSNAGYVAYAYHGDAVVYKVELRRSRVRVERAAVARCPISAPWSLGYGTSPYRGTYWGNGFAGFACGHVSEGATHWWLITPLWFWLVAFAVLPARSCACALTKRRRICNASCPTCGYDLRATPDRCPECGGVPAAR